MKEIACADGGTMLEVYRSEGWGQINVRVIPPRTSVASHRHPKTDEWWMLLRGRLWMGLEQTGKPPSEGWLEQGEMVSVSAGRGHRVENVDGTEAVLLYWMDVLYDPERPDKEDWVEDS